MIGSAMRSADDQSFSRSGEMLGTTISSRASHTPLTSGHLRALPHGQRRSNHRMRVQRSWLLRSERSCAPVRPTDRYPASIQTNLRVENSSTIAQITGPTDRSKSLSRCLAAVTDVGVDGDGHPIERLADQRLKEPFG